MDRSWDEKISLTVRIILYAAGVGMLGIFFGNTDWGWLLAAIFGGAVAFANEASRSLAMSYKRRSFGENGSIPKIGQQVVVRQLSPDVLTHFNTRYLNGGSELIAFRGGSIGNVGRVVGLIEDNILALEVVVLVSFPHVGEVGNGIPYSLDELRAV